MCCVNVISLSVILSMIERVLMFVYMYCVSYVWMIYLFNCYRTKKNYITSKSIIVTGNGVLFIYLPGNITMWISHIKNMSTCVYVIIYSMSTCGYVTSTVYEYVNMSQLQNVTVWNMFFHQWRIQNHFYQLF